MMTYKKVEAKPEDGGEWVMIPRELAENFLRSTEVPRFKRILSAALCSSSKFIDVWKRYMPSPTPREANLYSWCERFWNEGRAALSTEAQGDLKGKLRKILLSSEPEFHEKVIHGLDDDWQTYSVTLYMDIPFHYENGSYPKNFKPSKSAAEAIDAWLDELFKG